MKRLFGLVIVMFVIYLGIQFCFYYFGKGYEIIYNVSHNMVTEKYVSRTDNENDSYVFEIDTGTSKFEIITYNDYKKSQRIITDIKNIKTNNYECIYPIYKDKKYESNIVCMNNNIMYNYQDIKGRDNDLDYQISKLEYDVNKYYNHSEELEASKGKYVYIDNIVSTQYLGISAYKEIDLINNYKNNKFYFTTSLFKKDVINQNISIFADRYYLVADYNASPVFNKFYMVDLELGKKDQIVYHSNISFDSYIMGSIDDKVYLLDCDNKKQYEIDLKNKSMIEVGNSNIGIKFYDGKEFTTMNGVTAFKNRPLFSQNIENINGYDKVINVGGVKTGYKYYFKRSGNAYKTYRSVQNSDKLLYLFETTNINNIKFLNDYVYYQNGEYIMCYQDDMGAKPIYKANKNIYGSNFNFGIISGD